MNRLTFNSCFAMALLFACGETTGTGGAGGKGGSGVGGGGSGGSSETDGTGSGCVQSCSLCECMCNGKTVNFNSQEVSSGVCLIDGEDCSDFASGGSGGSGGVMGGAGGTSGPTFSNCKQTAYIECCT
jgi:hypothetical protein